MKVRIWIPLAAALVLAPQYPGAPRAAEASPQDSARGMEALGWLAGCWEQRRGESSTLEMWMPPAGDMMLGASRTVQAGRVRAVERLSLHLEDGRLVYTAFPSGQAETRFTGVIAADGSFAVENPAHDFPTKIGYRRLGADSLVARIEGPGSDGPRAVDFPMRRVRCER